MFGEYKRKNTVNHMFYLLMIRALKFKENYGYRIKVAGDEERYVAAIDGNVRSILAKDAPTIPNAQIVVQLLHTGSNMYKFKYCDRFLTAKPDDNGVVAIYSQETGLDVFDIQVEGTAFKFFNAKKNLCLAQTSSFDSALRGYSLNVSPCQDNIPNKFVLLEVGPIYYYCPEMAAAFCGVPSPVKPIHENIRYSHHGFLDNDVSLGHKNSSSWSFEGEYNTHGAEFSGDFDGFSGSAFGASVGYDRANAHGHPVDPRNPYHNLRRGHRNG